MPGCLVCGSATEIGVLCRACAQQVSPAENLIADHLRSTVDFADAEAWLVDGFGNAHAAAPLTRIGRAQEGELVVLASSVSREHAELKQTESGWSVRDLGSRNGTFVDGARTQGHVALAGRARLKVGEVALWFLAAVAHEPASAPPMETGGATGGLVRFAFAQGSVELCAVGGSDPGAGGSLLVRPAAVAGAAWSERGLAPLEFQLLRALCERAIAEQNLPSAVRGCVPTKQLARDLPFQSKYANEENVRQVVRRLRAVLTEVGADGAVAVAPGRGYYVSPVVTAGSDRP